jgi:hypothetical protein
MAAEPPVPDACGLWQRQPTEGGPMSAADARRKSEALQESARRRTTGLYMAGAGNAGIALVLMWVLPELRLALGYLVVTAAGLVWHVRRRSGQSNLQPLATADEGLAFYRQLLTHERDVRRANMRWFTIGPALNIVVLGLVYISSPLFHATVPEMAAMALIATTNVVALALVARKLRDEARAYQNELDVL